MVARGLSDEFSIENVASFMDATLPFIQLLKEGFNWVQILGSTF